jgi:hypothetical protein
MLKVNTVKILQNKIKKSDERDYKLNRILFPNDKEMGFYFKKEDVVVCTLMSMGESRIDGYPIFSVVEILDKTTALIDCVLMHNDEMIPFDKLELINPLEDNRQFYTGC